MTRIAVLGAGGRMGQAVIRCAQRMDSVRVVAAVEGSAHPALGQDAGVAAGIGPIGVKLAAATGAAAEADALIDFSSHDAAPLNVGLAVSLGKGLVLGTTGLDARESSVVKEAAARVPIVWSPNMSLGMNLLFAMAGKAAAALGLDYDVEIVETHHRHKQDAPSGTALRLAEKVARGRQQDPASVLKHGRQGLTGERPRGQIGMHALRAGDEVGEHRVLFANEGERIEFLHRASSRDALAKGALRAAVWVAGRKPGLYDMQDVLGL
jgi:4-hydroxy-tetrahydrodipicolinate reductase